MKLEHSISQAERYLASLDAAQFDSITFDWQGIRFNAKTEKQNDGTFAVRLQAILGRLYYTVENKAHRATAIDHLYRNNRKIDGAYSIAGKGDVHFNNLTTTKKKLVGGDLLIALATIMMQVESHLRPLKSLLKPC